MVQQINMIPGRYNYKHCQMVIGPKIMLDQFL